MIAIADSGFIIALAVRLDKHHDACLQVYRQMKSIVLPQSTFAEVMYAITRARGNSLASQFLREIPTTKYEVTALEPEDILRTAELLETYADTRVDFVDASIVAVAERLNITRVLTLDLRDFQIIRPRHAGSLTLLPIPE